MISRASPAQHSVRCQAGDSTVAVLERLHLGNNEHRQQRIIEGIVMSADAVPPLGECTDDVRRLDEQMVSGPISELFVMSTIFRYVKFDITNFLLRSPR